VRSDAGSRYSREFLSAYISGYADGEGCFTVSISPRATLVAGWEVRPSFSVSQNGDRAEVLHVLQAYFGCGSIRPDRSDRTVKWETRRLEDLLERVIPHFESYPLVSGKAVRLRAFRERVSPDGGRRTPKSGGPRRNRRAHARDEPERDAAIRRGSDTRESAPG
jgi:hypothetical protein